MDVSKTSDHFQIKIEMPNLSQEPLAPTKAPDQDLKNMDILCTFKIQKSTKIRIMGISKTSDHIQIKIKMTILSQEPTTSFKAPNEDLRDMDVLCTFKIKVESQNLYHGFVKDQ